MTLCVSKGIQKSNKEVLKKIFESVRRTKKKKNQVILNVANQGRSQRGARGASAPPGSSKNVFFFLAKMIQKMSFK